MIRFFSLIQFLFLILIVTPLKAESLKDLSAFKNQLARSQRTTLSLYNGLVYVGEFSAYINEKDIESADGKSFTKLMKSFLVEEKFNEFEKKFGERSLITKNDLNAFGFEFILDTSSFKLDLRTSELFLNPKRISLNEYNYNQPEVNVTPAPVSGFLNYSFTKNYIQKKLAPLDQSLIGSLDPNLNILSVNFESHHQLQSDRNWARTNSLISKDVESLKLRLSAGDISYSPRVFQSPNQLLGFRVSKQFDIDPYQIVTARGEREIYLDTPSTVEIFINGFLIQTLSLEPGKHLLEDLPVSQGINHIIIRISDNAGKKRYVLFQQTSSESMLKSGVHDFDYAVGTYAKPGTTNPEYSSVPVGSFYHRLGMTTNWTTGLNGEFKRNFFNGGPENQIATTRGLFVNNLSFSNARNDDSGIGAKLSYFWTCPCGVNEKIKRLALSYEYQSPKYLMNTFNETFAENNQRHILTLSYNQNLSESIAGLISTSLYSLDFNKMNKEQFTVGLNKNFKNGLFLNSTFQRTYDQKASKKETDAILFQLSYNFSDGKNNIITTYGKTEDVQNGQVEFTYNANKPVDNKIFRARVGEENSKKSAGLSGYYNSQKFEVLGSFDYSKATETKSYFINPSGSLSFAGTSFSLGQKIQQSFIIVDNALKEPLIVNGDEENHEAYLYADNSSTLTSVQPYVSKSVNVISDDNKSLGLSNKGYQVMTKYKRGSLLKIGNAITKMAEGILVNEKGIPYSLAGGKIVNMGTGAEISFFTGRNGKFYLDNVKPDLYQMMIYDRNSVRVLNIDLRDKLKEERNNLGEIVVR